jgi:hypothetical protein
MLVGGTMRTVFFLFILVITVLLSPAANSAEAADRTEKKVLAKYIPPSEDEDACPLPEFGNGYEPEKAAWIYRNADPQGYCAEEAARLLTDDEKAVDVLQELTRLLIAGNLKGVDSRIIDGMMQVYLRFQFNKREFAEQPLPDLGAVLRRFPRYQNPKTTECRRYFLEEPFDPAGCPLFPKPVPEPGQAKVERIK